MCAGAVLDAPEGSLRLLTDAEIAATEVLLNDANENGGTPVAPCTKAVVVQKACSLVIPIVDDDGNVTGSETYFNYAAKSQIKCIGKGGKTTNTFFSSDFTIAEPDPVTV